MAETVQDVIDSMRREAIGYRKRFDSFKFKRQGQMADLLFAIVNRLTAAQAAENEWRKRCPYCHEFETYDTDTYDFGRNEDITVDVGELLVNGDYASAYMAMGIGKRIGIFVSGETSSWHQINYCPICGRRLEAE